MKPDFQTAASDSKQKPASPENTPGLPSRIDRAYRFCMDAHKETAPGRHELSGEKKRQPAWVGVLPGV
jgi:hypothetical protein